MPRVTSSPPGARGHSRMRREAGRNCASSLTRASTTSSTGSRRRRTRRRSRYAISSSFMGSKVPVDLKVLAVRIRDEREQFVGIMSLVMTAVGMSTIGAIAAPRGPRPLRANAARRQGGAAPGGDPLRRPRRLLVARATPLHGQLLRARPPPRTSGGSVRDRCRRAGRQTRRGWGRGVLSGRDRRVGVCRRAQLHKRRPRAQGGGQRGRGPQRVAAR